MPLPYKISYNRAGKPQEIHFLLHNTWASLPFNPDSKSFDESDRITKALRQWEAANGAVDLSDRPGEMEPDAPPPQPNPSDIGAEPQGAATAAVQDHEGRFDHTKFVLGSDARLSNARVPTAHSHLPNEVGADSAGSAIATVGNHEAKLDPHPGYLLKTSVGASNGAAPLDANQLIPEVFLPAIAISDTFVINSQAAMLALNAQRGDVAVRSDLNKTFILKSAPASTLANWQELPTPTDQVLSVNGKSGVVVLSAADLSAVGLAGDQVIEGLKAFTGILRAQGPVDESLKGISRIDLGVQNGTARFVLESKNQNDTATTIWEIDNQDGVLRIFLPNLPPRFRLDLNGNLSILGALSVGNAAFAATTRTNLGIATTTTVAIPLNAANGWSAISGFGAVEVTKGTTGWCHCEGALSKILQPTKGETVGTLPTGYRPKKKLRFPSVGTSSANSEPYIEVDTTGVVTYNNAGTVPTTGSTITLSSIGFYAA